jgi:hypothetical protein
MDKKYDIFISHASIGASFKVVKYYDTIENYSGQQLLIDQAYSSLDKFEKSNVRRINQILS